MQENKMCVMGILPSIKIDELMEIYNREKSRYSKVFFYLVVDPKNYFEYKRSFKVIKKLKKAFKEYNKDGNLTIDKYTTTAPFCRDLNHYGLIIGKENVESV